MEVEVLVLVLLLAERLGWAGLAWPDVKRVPPSLHSFVNVYSSVLQEDRALH